jgi:hypothetical protein
VQIPRDLQPFGGARPFGEQLTRGEELGIALSELRPMLGFASRDMSQENRKKLKPEPRGWHVDGDFERPRPRQQPPEGKRLEDRECDRGAERQP